jgi:hypothetical protein
VGFRDVLDASTGLAMDDWKQLLIKHSCGRTDHSMRYGIDIIHDDPTGRFKCEMHNYVGLKALSEVTLPKWVQGYDLGVTTNRVGLYSASETPSPLIVCTKRLYDLLKTNSITGVRYEVAYIHDGRTEE